ncbi:N-acetylmuramoyl-L-alanine amidase [uncultured Acetobacteroides sp.]|uniref:N-acetylmuramoyl-L-alanine amidase family protein n=1 Tax=uncultured Acetobacteroides sp. TaxID=1760811 RepID=UPI0029F568DD|nr:N-acetylmuramoyl-L-alanine amidase [uncultured Acetobacteroides sp.]
MLCAKNRAFFTRRQVLLAVCVVAIGLYSSSGYCQSSNRSLLTRVVIDAGHGGKDPGAKGKNAMEKDIVLSVALKLGKLISENYSDVKVIYTRESDVFIPLDVRSRIANKSGANLFISIHANANKSSVPFGAETYVMGLHKSADNFDVAARENSAIIMEDNYNATYEGFNPKSVESYIIFSMMQSKFLDQSLFFAQLVQNQVAGSVSRVNRGVKQAGFLVLWKTAMPSVLVELGFISNPKDEQYMLTEAGQNELAESIFRSFKAYKVSYDNKNYVQLPPQVPTSSKNDSIEKSKDKAPIVETSVKNDADSIARSAIVFRVQIAGSKGIPFTKSQKRSLDDADELLVDGVYKYCVGSFDKLSDANVYLREVKRNHRDAFVIALENGKLISVKEAQQKIR